MKHRNSTANDLYIKYHSFILLALMMDGIIGWGNQETICQVTCGFFFCNGLALSDSYTDLLNEKKKPSMVKHSFDGFVKTSSTLLPNFWHHVLMPCWVPDMLLRRQERMADICP